MNRGETILSADFTPDYTEYSGVSPFKWWAQSVIPLVYDSSLSYYETLCKVTDYLNRVINDLGLVETNSNNLLTAYQQLQTYVNDYFDNLNVQDEINNSLDEMAKNGTLANLVAPIIHSYSAPVFVNEIGEMTDQNKTYVLIGTGHIFTWNGMVFEDTNLVYDINGLTFIYRNTLIDNFDISVLSESGFYFYTNKITGCNIDTSKTTNGTLCLYSNGDYKCMTIYDTAGVIICGKSTNGIVWDWNYNLPVDATLSVSNAPADSKTVGDKFNALFKDKPSLNPMKINGFSTVLLTDDRSWQMQSMCKAGNSVYLFFSGNTDGLTKYVETDMTFNLTQNIGTLYAGHANSCFYDGTDIVISSGGVVGETPWIGEPNNVLVHWNPVTKTVTRKHYLTEMETIYWIGSYNGNIYACDGSYIYKYTQNYAFLGRSKYMGKNVVGPNYGFDINAFASQNGITDKWIITNYFLSGDAIVPGSQNTDYYMLAFWDYNYNLIYTSLLTSGVRQEVEGMFIDSNVLYLSFAGPETSFYKCFLSGNNTNKIIDSYYTTRNADLNKIVDSAVINGNLTGTLTNAPDWALSVDKFVKNIDVGDNLREQFLIACNVNGKAIVSARQNSKSSGNWGPWRYLIDNTMQPLINQNTTLTNLNQLLPAGMYTVSQTATGTNLPLHTSYMTVIPITSTTQMQLHYTSFADCNIFIRMIDSNNLDTPWYSLYSTSTSQEANAAQFNNDANNFIGFSIIDQGSYTQINKNTRSSKALYINAPISLVTLGQIILPYKGTPIYRKVNYSTKEITKEILLGNSVHDTIELEVGDNKVNIVTLPKNHGPVSFDLTYAIQIGDVDLYGKADIYANSQNTVRNFIQNHTPIMTHANYPVSFGNSSFDIYMNINCPAASTAIVSITTPNFMHYNV